MLRRTRLQVECLEDRTVPSSVTFDAAPAFRGLDVAVVRFIPQEPTRPLAAAPVFALNYATFCKGDVSPYASRTIGR